MILYVTLPTDERGRDQRSLLAWFRQHDEIRTNARITLVPAPQQPGSMGSVFDAIQLALDPAFDLANLLVAIAAWRRACRPQAATTVQGEARTITVQANGDVVITTEGRTVTVPADAASDPASVRQALGGATTADGGEPDGTRRAAG
ncbi:hypothetical protein ACF08N_05380 [Streptomyces sp. NPDC015127]|uniref:effector-associated constant component EACC1 n=1 Tax=Streptomyces sp. NPDC015127 TaxID=3364939 RepID=UPI0036FE2C5D